ncbi:MAG: hypothetical protein IKW01_02505 [Firmicutes bacterium]|nr:hypothetical protein [Bacillota bacterium]
MTYIAEEYKPIYKEILTVLQKKYNYMTEICRLTEEMEKSLQRDDRISTQMLISMRQEEIEGIQQCDRELDLYVDSLPQTLQEWMKDALKGTELQSEECGMEDNLVLKLSANIRSAWEKTIRIDKHVNQKLAGEDSFYYESKNRE